MANALGDVMDAGVNRIVNVLGLVVVVGIVGMVALAVFGKDNSPVLLAITAITGPAIGAITGILINPNSKTGGRRRSDPPASS